MRLAAPAVALAFFSFCAVSAAQNGPNILPPKAYFDRLHEDPHAFDVAHGYLPLVRKVRTNLALFASPEGGQFLLPGIFQNGGLFVNGVKTLPVAPVLMSDMNSRPYAAPKLAQMYFDGPWPTETMAEFYNTMSYGNLTLKGDVPDWQQLPQSMAYYAGDDDPNAAPCFGWCPNNRIRQLVADFVAANPNKDWSEFDNDGPDRMPNSGDDDGFVDFLVIVHPGKGGECGGNRNIWSHRSHLSTPVATNTPSRKPGFGNISISDYVIVPALACDGTQNPIGTVSHEFGHAFGLPDLYDITYATFGGVGAWDLMAYGGYGADLASGYAPVQMSAWSKIFLGWVRPTQAVTDIADINLKPIDSTSTAIQVGSGDHYFLLSNRQKICSPHQASCTDPLLPASGLMVEKIDASDMQNRLASNTVNSVPGSLGVQVVEADGKTFLVTGPYSNLTNPGDLFPLPAGSVNLDIHSQPATPGNFALCGLSQVGDTIHGRLQLTNPDCSSHATPARFAPQHGAAPHAAASLPAFLDNPERFLGKPVAVSGKLLNTGKNYFTDFHLALADANGKTIPVQVEAPVELPPSVHGVRPPTDTVSTWLGKNIVATGQLVHSKSRDGEDLYMLKLTDVKSSDTPASKVQK